VGIQRVPNLLRWTVLACCLPYPGDPKSAIDCFFLFGISLHPGVTGSAPHWKFRGCRVHSFPSPQELLRPASWLALLSRTFTFELAPTRSPSISVEYDYVDKQSIPTAGLSPASPTALWAAGHRNSPPSSDETLFSPEKIKGNPADDLENTGSSALKSRWSTRELERQIGSLLFERLALSRDKEGVRALAEKGHEVMQLADLVKDPYVLEFAGLPQGERYLEADLEQALIDKLSEFLLELGKGFAFMGRQLRIIL